MSFLKPDLTTSSAETDLRSSAVKRMIRLVTATAAALLASVVVAAGAEAGPSDYGIESVDASVSTTQAGAHPDLVQTLNFKLDPETGATYAGTENIKVDLPPGLIGNPTQFPRCDAATLVDSATFGNPACAQDSQVGIVDVTLNIGTMEVTIPEPLYNVVPGPDSPARLGFLAVNVPVFIDLSVRSDGDYGITATTRGAENFFAVNAIKVTTWGMPSDPSHDALRMTPQEAQDCFYPCYSDNGLTRSSGLPRVPFMTNATSCQANRIVGFEVTSYPGKMDSASAAFPAMTGCEAVPFDPVVDFDPTTSSADSPSGMDVDFDVDQDGLLHENTLGPAHLKKAVVTLPEGMSLNPSAADGLGSCSESQVGLVSRSPVRFDKSDVTCPESSKVGTAQITTPLLNDPVEGSLYVAEQGDNPFGSLLAGYLVAKGPGLIIKLAGNFELDQNTGRIKAVFDNNPQQPFSNLKLRFKGGSRGVLVTPPTCGTYSIETDLIPWSAADPDNPTAGEVEHRSSSFQITSGPNGGPCPNLMDPAAFQPGFMAGSVTPFAGQSSPFVFKVSRSDGQQEFQKISAQLPSGLTAKLAGIPRCPQANVVPGVGGSTNCPAASRVGSVTVSAGAGSTPFFLGDQPVYLTQGYDGAPFGLAIDTHALAGPFDLGHVVVRSKLNVDPATAEVSAESENVPRIVQGIPLHIRSIALNMDRPGFMLNPTSCAAMQIRGQVQGTGGATANLSDRFQVGDCAALSFAPKLSLALTGRKQVTTGKHPGVKAVVTQKASGAAGIKKAVVALPKALALDPDNAQALCEFEDGTKPDLDKRCPKGSIVGRAKAITPLLDKPLAGNVYFVKNVRIDKRTGNRIRTLPMIVVALRGEIAINLKGESSTTKGGQLINTFATVPDAPVTRFNLNIKGGNNGILTVTRTRRSKINLCTTPRTAQVDLDAHNGKRSDFNTRVKTPCAKKKAAKKTKR
jgi:hypothetical protein